MNWHICHKKNYFFCSYFQHISLCFYSNFDWKSSLDVEFDSASNEYPHYILLTDLTTPKIRNNWKTWWWCHHHVFQVFLIFRVAGSVKSMQCGYSLDVELNSASNEYPHCILLIDVATPKMWWWCHHHVFQVFLIFGVARSIKSMQCGYSLDA